MKTIAQATMVGGLFAGVLSLGLLIGGWWGLASYSLVAAGLLLIAAGAFGAMTAGQAKRLREGSGSG
jgi:hypothetical protein